LKAIIFTCTDNNQHLAAHCKLLYHHCYSYPVAYIMTFSSNRTFVCGAIAVKWLRKISLGNPTPQEAVEMLIFNLKLKSEISPKNYLQSSPNSLKRSLVKIPKTPA